MFILVTAALILSGAYYYVIRQEKRSKKWSQAEGVYHFVRHQLKMGFSEERIKRDLAKLDWSKDLSEAPAEESDVKRGSLRDQGALVLRFGLGLVFFYQGLFVKLIQQAPTHISFCNSFEMVSMPGGTSTIVMGFLQLIFAVLLLIGLWTRFVAALSTLYLTQVTMFISVTGSPVTDVILLLTTALALIILGGGNLSVDKYIGIP